MQDTIRSKTPSQDSKHLLSKTEAAIFLGISNRTLDEWRKKRIITVIDRPGYIRFSRHDLEEFLSECRIERAVTSTRSPRRKKVQ